MEIVDYENRYANKLAKMWNSSDEGWPGGITRGIPMTADKVKETESRMKCIGRFIIMEKGEAIGYVRVNPYTQDKEAAYVSWLNVVPTHHGKSYGRKLLCKCVECSRENAFERLDLHTWPGNMKALPAYKKTGFFWVPKTSVYMQNYVPMILQFPPATSYFKKHDWYRTFERKIELVEDDIQVEGMNVFPYRWKEGGDELGVWVDRESRSITGFENNEVKVFAKLDRHDVLTGMTWKMTWKIVNKTKRKLSCSLKATPPKGVQMSASEKFEVPAGRSKEISAGLKVSLDVKEKPQQEKSDSILTRMKIGNQSFTLKTGLRTKPAIEIETDPEFISLSPETKKKIFINLKNNMKRRVKGWIDFEADGLHINKKGAHFAIEKDKAVGIPLTIMAGSSEAKSYSIRARTSFDGLHTKEKVLRGRCIGSYGVVSDVEDDRLVMENGEIRLVAHRRGGYIDLYDKSFRDPLVQHLHIRLGPPFWPSELSRLNFHMKVRNERDSSTAWLSTLSEEKEGLKISIQIGMSSNNLVQIIPILENRGEEDIRCQIQYPASRELYGDKITIPSKYGIIQEEVIEDDFPDWMGDVPPKGYFQETWLHVGNRETGIGLIWDPNTSREVELGGWQLATITLDAPMVGPGERKDLPPYYLLVATPDWQSVRKAWLRLMQGQIEWDERVRPYRVLEATTIPGPLVMEDETEFKLSLTNLRNKKLDGNYLLRFPVGFQASRTKLEVKGLSLKKSFEETISLKARKVSAGVYSAKGKLSTALFDHITQFPIVIIGKPGRVSVRELKERVVVENGRLQLTIAPNFAGSIISLQEDETEQVLSSYPESSSLLWIRPWYGGIHPVVLEETFMGRLYEEVFTHKKASRGPWKGVRVQTTVEKSEKLRGLMVSTEFLTRPKSNVVTILQDFTNSSRSSLYFQGGCVSFLQPAGSKRTSAYFSRSGWRQRKYSKWSAFSTSDNQTVVIENPRKRKSICFVSPTPRRIVHLFDLAQEGKHVLALSKISLRPKETKRSIDFLVSATTSNEAKKYHVFSEYVDEDLLR